MCEDPEPDKTDFPDVVLLSGMTTGKTMRDLSDRLGREGLRILIVDDAPSVARLGALFAIASSARREDSRCLTISVRHSPALLTTAALLAVNLRMPPVEIAMPEIDLASMAEQMRVSLPDIVKSEPLPQIERPWRANDPAIYGLQARDRSLQVRKQNRLCHADRRFH